MSAARDAELVAAAQRGEPVADWLEERIEQEVRLDCAVRIRSHDG